VTILSVEGVSKSYGIGGFFSSRRSKIVLSDIDLRIGEGECVGLLGASGSGKSTLGRLVVGIERPDCGSVRYRGQPMLGLTGDDYRVFRRNVQVVFQDSIGAVNPRHRIRRIVAEPLVKLDHLSGPELDERVRGLLETVEIDPGEADKYPGQMSGGQLQRVCIARALAPKPELIVLDEAVSNLDLALQLAVLDLLDGLRRQRGVAFLFITHDLRLVRRLCDRVVVLDGGRVIEERRVASGLSFTHPAAVALQNAVLPAMPAAHARVERIAEAAQA
jgi:nickel transport system ATP-binding protein